MAVDPGHHQLGPEHGRLILRTSREGFGSRAGHDLAIEVTRWSADLTVGDDLTPAALDVRADLRSLTVREGTGGVKPLTDRDRREITATAGKVLGADRNPEVTFSATGIERAGGGWQITGKLTLAGTEGSAQLQVSEIAPDRYRATGSIVQSDFGIKPYTAFLGALKVGDAVEVEAEADLGGGGGGQQ